MIRRPELIMAEHERARQHRCICSVGFSAKVADTTTKGGARAGRGLDFGANVYTQGRCLCPDNNHNYRNWDEGMVMTH